MSERIKIKAGIITVKRSDGIFVGHLHNHEIFTNEAVLPIIRILREWTSIEQLLTVHGEELTAISSVISRLEQRNFLDKSGELVSKPTLIISHMNELGTLLSAILIEKGYDITTLDARSSQISDVRGQFIRISDAGESFQEIIASQKREIRNSGNQDRLSINEESSLFNNEGSNLPLDGRAFLSENPSLHQRLVLITTYPEPELLAELMETQTDYLCAFTTPNGAIIGPFVRPGATPCFHCMELTLSNSDTQWQKVAATLFTERFAKLEMANVLLAASLLIDKISSIIEGELPHDSFAQSSALSFSARQQGSETGVLEHRSQRWSFHPECSCHWR